MGDDETSPNGDEDPFGSYDLHEISIGDKAVFDLYFSSCATHLSDYSFANTFIWRDSIHLRWRVIHDCLCVFANGDGGLTMLFPPIGRGDLVAPLRESLRICADYNQTVRYAGLARVEYVSRDVMDRLTENFSAVEMSGDYVYLTQRMIDLNGGDLASKRQARNRFARRYEARTEAFAPQHLEECLKLLAMWTQQHQEQDTAGVSVSVRLKRAKEVAATADAIRNAQALGLKGMVLYAGAEMAGFTFGEMLDGGQTCSIVIEKTNREFTGSAQYIFSEFCRQYWAATKWCNVGDDWEVPSLAWTKESYRPALRIPKWIIRPVPQAAFQVVELVTEAPSV